MNNPVKGDWYLQVMEDLKNLEIASDFNEIENIMKTTSKISFKNLVKNKSKIATLKYLNNIKSGHSKMDNLNYREINLQSYLNSSEIHPQLAKTIFKWRTRMVNFKNNFRNGNDDISCALGCRHVDSQESLLK